MREEAVRRDAADHAAEFVHVRVDHDARAGRALRRDNRAHAVEGDRRGERLHLFHQQLAYRLLEAGRSGRIRQALQQVGYAILTVGRRAGNDEREGKCIQYSIRTVYRPNGYHQFHAHCRCFVLHLRHRLAGATPRDAISSGFAPRAHRQLSGDRLALRKEPRHRRFGGHPRGPASAHCQHHQTADSAGRHRSGGRRKSEVDRAAHRHARRTKFRAAA